MMKLMNLSFDFVASELLHISESITLKFWLENL